MNFVNSEIHRLSFGCHVAVGNVAPGFCIRDVSGGRGELAHLSFLLPVSVHGCWHCSCLFQGLHHHLGGHLHLFSMNEGQTYVKYVENM